MDNKRSEQQQRLENLEKEVRQIRERANHNFLQITRILEDTKRTLEKLERAVESGKGEE